MADRSMPDVSVVIPTFNGASWLPGTVDHVLAAFRRSDVIGELIVIDDGSTDDTPDVLDRLRGTSAFRWVRQEQLGASAARNCGVAEARGGLIGLLDVDDRWTEAMFDALLPVASAPGAPPIVQGRVVDDFGGAMGQPYDAMNIGSAWFRRGVFDVVGPFDERLQRLEDYDWFLRAHDLRVPKQRLDVVALRWRRHGAGLTSAAPRPDPLHLRVQRTAMQRRRAGLPAMPVGFPALADYLGLRADDAATRPTGSHLRPNGEDLVRLDDRPIDERARVAAAVCVRNEADRLPALLSHHRAAGVDAFFVVDNGSTDGGVEWLLEQPDVHVWSATGSFAVAQFGGQWVLSLLERHRIGAWCLVIDADELFVAAVDPVGTAAPSDEPWLHRLCTELEHEGAEALVSIMVDLYPRGPVSAARHRAGDDPLALCRWFDREVWTHRSERFHEYAAHESYFGGMRRRVFGSDPDAGPAATYFTLNKVPLFRYRPGLAIAPSFHWLDGAKMSSGRGALLHWKYTDAFVRGVPHEISRGEHWDGASQYRRYATVLGGEPELTIFDESISVEYRDVDQLIELGVVVPVPVPDGVVA